VLLRSPTCNPPCGKDQEPGSDAGLFLYIISMNDIMHKARAAYYESNQCNRSSQLEDEAFAAGWKACAEAIEKALTNPEKPYVVDCDPPGECDQCIGFDSGAQHCSFVAYEIGTGRYEAIEAERLAVDKKILEQIDDTPTST